MIVRNFLDRHAAATLRIEIQKPTHRTLVGPTNIRTTVHITITQLVADSRFYLGGG